MKIVYTDSGNLELPNYLAQQQKLLERLISERKAVLGDETLEITASDIQSASNRIRVVNTKIARDKVPELVTRFYVVLGVATMVVGFAYPYLLELYKSNSYQGVFITLGACMSVVGALASTLYSYRRKAAVENEVFKESAKSLDQVSDPVTLAKLLKILGEMNAEAMDEEVAKTPRKFHTPL